MANISYDVGIHEIYQTCFSHLKSRWGLHDAKCVLSQHPVRGRITVLKGEARSQMDGAFFFLRFLIFFSHVDHFLKFLLNLLQHCFCFILFYFFGHEACGILAPCLGINALKGKVSTTGPPGKSSDVTLKPDIVQSLWATFTPSLTSIFFYCWLLIIVGSW